MASVTTGAGRLPAALTRRRGNLLGFAASAALIAYALYVQYVLGLEPCPLCILQRVAVMAVGALFLLAALHDPSDRGAPVYAILIDLAALAGILVAVRHLWILAQPAGSVAECGASLDYMMDVLPLHEVLAKVLAGSGECAKVDWEFLGLTMPAWVLVALVGLGAWGVLVNLVAKRR
ncbi:MAG: disulfide bond formation protein B [Lysobacterales bacterium]|jgi:disulfide bond formation protein DsbB|nr:MAG: disulfide bond formation protein B [Xanthomonadales bacterium]